MSDLAYACVCTHVCSHAHDMGAQWEPGPRLKAGGAVAAPLWALPHSAVCQEGQGCGKSPTPGFEKPARCLRELSGPCQPPLRAPLRPLPTARLPEPVREARSDTRGGPTGLWASPTWLRRDSPGQCISPAAGPPARWSLQQGEKNLTRHFKPISWRASREPQRAPDNPICCE